MRLIVKLACFLLKLRALSMRDRTTLVCAILDVSNALPLKEIISRAENGALLVSGRPLEIEEMIALRESAGAALNNKAFTLIMEQVASIAGTRGVSEGDTPEKLYFYRAATWFGGQIKEHLSTLASREE